MIHQISVDTFTHHEDYTFFVIQIQMLRKIEPHIII